MGLSVACLGDPVVMFRPPGLNIMALASGIPAAGLLAIPLDINGLIQKGSEKFRVESRGVAHIGDPVKVTMPPTLAITGSISGTVTFSTPLTGIIEGGSGVFRVGGRGLARVGDSVLVMFPPTLAFTGTFAGQPLAGPIAILTPVRGIIQRGSARFAVA